ncbi:MAG: NAD(P)H-dependent FMN reductase [Candidatus Nanohaloarchaea archaeon]|jgi:NAD(P)H-dependent FMN reductase
MDFLLLIGSTRDGRKSIHAGEFLESKLEEAGHSPEIFDLKEKEIPFLNNRTYADEGEAPENAQLLSEKVQETDCIIIITPEYNHSIPGVLKNAIDHLYPEYDDKPFAFVTTSAGGFGGVRGLQHLHDIVLEIGGFPGSNLPVSNINDVFSEDGELEDESYHSRVERYIEDVEEHVEKIN